MHNNSSKEKRSSKLISYSLPEGQTNKQLRFFLPLYTRIINNEHVVVDIEKDGGGNVTG